MTISVNPKAVDGAVYWAMDEAVDWAVIGAVRGAVYGAVNWAVDWAVNEALHGAVDWAVRVGPLHPNLRLFMAEIRQTRGVETWRES